MVVPPVLGTWTNAKRWQPSSMCPSETGTSQIINVERGGIARGRHKDIMVVSSGCNGKPPFLGVRGSIISAPPPCPWEEAKPAAMMAHGCTAPSQMWTHMNESYWEGRPFIADAELFLGNYNHSNLEVLTRPARPELRTLRAETLEAAAVRSASPARWSRMVARSAFHHGLPSRLNIVVLGSSVTSGCGALKERLCDVRFSWARRLRDWLGHWNLGASRLQIHARNGVAPNFFTQCAERYFGGRPDIVVLEFQSILQVASLPEGGAALPELEPLLIQIRRDAPDACVLFVGWPNHFGNTSNFERTLVRFAIRHEMDVVLASRMMPHHAGGRRQWAYSEQPTDITHPSAAGAELLAEGVAYFLATRLGEAACAVSAALASVPGDVESRVPPLRPPQRGVEWCADRANQLPIGPLNPSVARKGNFSLVDEGGAKGVQKLGYLSTTVGSQLRLGPLLPELTCVLAEARLGYLASWRPEQGTFDLKCEGCACSRSPGFEAKRLSTFPHINSQEAAAVTVTREIDFLVLKEHPHPCFVAITHTEAGDASNSTTRVRIDSLSIRVLSCRDTCLALGVGVMSRATTRLLSQFGATARLCAVGAALGRVGHAGPACLGATSNTSEMYQLCAGVVDARMVDKVTHFDVESVVAVT